MPLTELAIAQEDGNNPSIDLSTLRPSVAEVTAHHEQLRRPCEHASGQEGQDDNGHSGSRSSARGSLWRRWRRVTRSGFSLGTLYSNLDDRRDYAMLWFGVVFAVGAGIPLPIIFYLFGEIISSFPPQEADLRNMLGELLGIAVLYFALTTMYMSAFGVVGERLAIRIRQKLLRCLITLDQTYYDSHQIDINGLLTEKVETIQAGTSEKVGIFVQSISYFVVAIITGFTINAKLTGILLAAAIPMVVLLIWIGSKLTAHYSKAASRYVQNANDVLESAIRSVRVVQAFDMADEMRAQHAMHLTASSSLTFKSACAAAVQLGAFMFTGYALSALAYFVGSRMDSSTGGAGTVYAVILLVMDGSMVVAQFAPFLEVIQRASAAGELMSDLFQQEQKVIVQVGHKTTPQRVAHQRGLPISFRNVGFTYPTRTTAAALNGICLDIEPGSITGIVGTSGGGKSTLVALLTRTYDGFSGSVTIGNRDLTDIPVDELRGLISVVEQEHVLFTGTVYENICYGAIGLGLTDTELTDRCEDVVSLAALDFLEDMPRGLHTKLDNSLQLSGGQKQRICLARALIRKAPILILDEPTSALDARSERLIVKAVHKAAASGTAVIMVAHRLSTVLEADKIAVFSEGQVVEYDKPSALTTSDSVFRTLLDAQQAQQFVADVRIAPTKVDCEDDTSGEESSPKTPEDNEILFAETKLPKMATPTETNVAVMLFRLARPERIAITVALVSSAISGMVILGEAIISGNLIHLLNDNPRASAVDLYCLLFFVVALVALASYSISGILFGFASARLVARMQKLGMDNILRQDLAWFAEPGHGVQELVATLTNDAGAFASLSGVVLGTILSTFVMMIGGLVLGLIVAWKITIVLLSAVPVILVSGFLRFYTLAKYESSRKTAYSESTGLAIEFCRKIQTVRLLGLQDKVCTQFRNALAGPYRRGLKFTCYSNVILAAAFAVPYFVYALAYWWGSRQVRNGNYSETQFFIILPAVLFSAQASGRLFSFSPEMTRAKAAANSIMGILESQPSIMPPREPLEISTTSSSALDLKSTRQPSEPVTMPKIELADAALTYPSNDAPTALSGMSIQVKAGERIALVGPSGAGKSSAIALLERFFEVTDGAVYVDGRDIRDIPAVRLRDRIGLVPQEPELFPGSISYNIRLGKTKGQHITDTDIEDVCRRCGLHDFIQSLPEGYATECNSNGNCKLSGGQQQRLCIARALIRNPEILLLDEPTSALDALTERQIQAALDDASEGRTTITIAHRLASILHVDRIFVLECGRVVEEGTHADLIRQNGLYASMARAQSLA